MMKFFSFRQKLISLPRLYFSLFMMGLVLTLSIAIASVHAQVQLTEQSKVSIYGIGPVRAGMTIDEASRAAGTPMSQEGQPIINKVVDGKILKCSYYIPQGGPEKVIFLGTDGIIGSVHIENKQITTVNGAKIGDTEEKIFSLYPGQIQVTIPPISGRGHYLTVIPTAAQDKNYRLIFFTLGDVVLGFHAGKLPEVEFPEGCI